MPCKGHRSRCPGSREGEVSLALRQKAKNGTHPDGLHGARAERGIHRAHEARHDAKEFRQAGEVAVARVVVLVALKPLRHVADGLTKSEKNEQ